MYDLLLFLHVLAAFMLVAGTVCLVPHALTRAEGPVVERLFKTGGILSAVGGMGTLVFGLLLVWDAEYRFFTAWIIGALVLWLVGTGTGDRIGKVERAQSRPLLIVVSLAVLGVLVLMIWKPGV